MISKNFNRSEFACKCRCGFSTVDVELLEVLELVRAAFNSPVSISSACRCESYNRHVGGGSESKHLQGIAADIVVKGVEPKVVYTLLNDMNQNKFGIGSYKTFTHIDVRPNRARW
tara:strand:+ start:37 stop:381 length:345 start_codon:yes stop_codon:yes gene_type:complete